MLTPIAASIHANPMIADRSLSRSHRRSHEKYNRHTNIAAFMIVATMRSMDAIIGNVLISGILLGGGCVGCGCHFWWCICVGYMCPFLAMDIWITRVSFFEFLEFLNTAFCGFGDFGEPFWSRGYFGG